MEKTTFNFGKMHRSMLGIMALATLGITASCSSDEITEQPQTPANAIHFTAKTGTYDSRMINSAWEDNDQVGVKIGDQVKTYYISDTGTGAMATNDADPFKWEDGQTYDVTAWYPVNDVHLDVTNQTEDVIKTAESLISAQATVNTQEAALTFKHQTARIQYNLQGGLGYSDEDLKAAKVTFYGYGSADFHEGTLTPVGELTGEITPKHPDLTEYEKNEDGSNKTDENGQWIVKETIPGGDMRNGDVYVIPAEYWDKPMVKIEVAGDVFIYTPRHSNATDEEKQRGSIKPGSWIKLYFWVDKSQQVKRLKVGSSNIEGWGANPTDGGRVDTDAQL